MSTQCTIQIQLAPRWWRCLLAYPLVPYLLRVVPLALRARMVLRYSRLYVRASRFQVVR